MKTRAARDPRILVWPKCICGKMHVAEILFTLLRGEANDNDIVILRIIYLYFFSSSMAKARKSHEVSFFLICVQKPNFAKLALQRLESAIFIDETWEKERKVLLINSAAWTMYLGFLSLRVNKSYGFYLKVFELKIISFRNSASLGNCFIQKSVL